MAWILGTAALYGFAARDANPRNWGRRATTSSWLTWLARFYPGLPVSAAHPDTLVVELGRSLPAGGLPVAQSHRRDLRSVFSLLYWQLVASGQAKPVVAALLRQECLYFTPTGEPAVAAPLKGTLQPSDWRLLSLKPVEATQLLNKEVFGPPLGSAP